MASDYAGNPQQLRNAGIPPGYQTARDGPRADTALRGTNYISYRYEKGCNRPDPFSQLQVQVPRQLPNKPWQRIVQHQSHV